MQTAADQQPSPFPASLDDDIAARAVAEVERLRAALKIALPYVQHIAGTNPTEYNRMVRQRQACRDVDAIQAALSLTQA